MKTDQWQGYCISPDGKNTEQIAAWQQRDEHADGLDFWSKTVNYAT